MAKADYERVTDFKSLETRLYDPNAIEIEFAVKNKVQLILGTSEGKHVIKLLIPCFHFYELRSYKNAKEAKKAFEDYSLLIQGGATLRIIDSYKAELL